VLLSIIYKGCSSNPFIFKLYRKGVEFLNKKPYRHSPDFFYIPDKAGLLKYALSLSYNKDNNKYLLSHFSIALNNNERGYRCNFK